MTTIKLHVRRALFVLTITLLGLTPALVAAQSVPSQDTSLTAEIISLTNTDRSAAGLGTITENAALSAAAQQKANDMLANQYFAHVSPSGGAPWQWFRANGYTYAYAAENLAMNFYSAHDVEQAWLNSPGHRANIMSGKYNEMGVGIARGIYQGKPVIFIVEFFGTQSVAKAVYTTKRSL